MNIELSPDEEKFAMEAVIYIKKNKRNLLARFADSKIYLPSPNPISLFMAGSPGAGKTETSKALLESGRFIEKPIRIDADEMRDFFSAYNGANAAVFQRAVDKGVNILFDFSLKKNISCILDGTFAYAAAHENVSRSLQHNRKVIIYYVYQDLSKAWEVTQAREALKKRHVPKEVFARAAVLSRANVELVKSEFADQVELNLVTKDFEASLENVYPNIAVLDPRLVPRYTEEEISKLLT